MLATARWMYRSALQRTETRGMHRRKEHPERDDAQHHRLVSGGLDEVWVRRQAVVAAAAVAVDPALRSPAASVLEQGVPA
jgi:succinate dehydrogenase/fumarate reductase flavoprotein subunit